MDMFHEGHKNLIDKMKERAREVIVILHDDYSTFENKGRFPVQDEQHRIENLHYFIKKRNLYLTFKKDPSCEIMYVIREKMKANKDKSCSFVYMRGDDWADFPGRELVENLKIPIEFVKYTDGMSSSIRRDQIKISKKQNEVEEMSLDEFLNQFDSSEPGTIIITAK